MNNDGIVKIWSSDKTTLRLAIQHMREWYNEIDHITDPGTGNINVAELDTLLVDLSNILDKLHSFEVRCQARQTPPDEI